MSFTYFNFVHAPIWCANNLNETPLKQPFGIRIKVECIQNRDMFGLILIMLVSLISIYYVSN